MFTAPAALLAAGVATSALWYNRKWHRQEAMLRLQWHRKEVAVHLLSVHRFETVWVDALRKVSDEADEMAVDWATVKDDDQDMYDAARVVLNNLEFLAIAVFSKAADEDIVHWTYCDYYTRLAQKLKPFILSVQNNAKDDSIWCHVLALGEKWKDEPHRPRVIAHAC